MKVGDHLDKARGPAPRLQIRAFEMSFKRQNKSKNGSKNRAGNFTFFSEKDAIGSQGFSLMAALFDLTGLRRGAPKGFPLRGLADKFKIMNVAEFRTIV